MKHYDYIEWLLYKNEMLSKEKSEEMKEHLYGCDTCMEIFLSLIDENEEETAGEIISDDFTSKVLNNTPKANKRNPEVKQNKQNKQNRKTFYYQFGYYAAVASVTIILTLSGLYTNLVDAVPKLTDSIQITEESSNLIADLSNSIVNSTSGFLFSIENFDRNNGRNE
jgi:hypothetical protein